MLKLASSLGLYCQDVPTAAIRVLSDAHQGGKEARPPHDSSAGWIVVENNFRVYAYTSRVSAMRILSIFVRLEYRLPNLVVGTITRQSARSALMDWVRREALSLWFFSFHVLLLLLSKRECPWSKLKRF